MLDYGCCVEYHLRCEKEQAYVYVWTESDPDTWCPNGADHVIQECNAVVSLSKCDIDDRPDHSMCALSLVMTDVTADVTVDATADAADAADASAEAIAKFTEPRVSALTATASLGHNVDLEGLWEGLAIPTAGGVVAIRHSSGSACRPAGAIETGKRPFGTQMTALVSIEGRAGAHANVKIFKNGTLQITGTKSREEAASVARAVKACVSNSEAMDRAKAPFDVRVRMLNVNMHVEPRIPRAAFVRFVANEGSGVRVSFDPAISSIAKVSMCFDTDDEGRVLEHTGACKCKSNCSFAPARLRKCHRCVVMLHGTGTVTFKGSCSEVHVRRACELFRAMVVRFLSRTETA